MSNINAILEVIRPFIKRVVSISDKRVDVETDLGNIRNLAVKLKEMGFDHVKSVTGIDYPHMNAIVVVYHVSSYEPGLSSLVLSFRIKLERQNPRTPSLTDIWPSAEYLERETYDLLGVVFEGHPRLERLLLLPDEYEGVFPLRKDYRVVEEGLEA